MDVAVSTSDLHAEGLFMENTSAEMSPVARQANAGKLGGRKPEKIARNCPWGAPTRLNKYSIEKMNSPNKVPLGEA